MPEMTVINGMYFEEYEIGQRVRTEGRTISEADIVNFAGLSGDFNPIHTDEAYAAQTPFGRRVAHGALVLSVATGLAYRTRILEGTVMAFRAIDEWKLSAPVYIGDTIHCEVEVAELKEQRRLGGGLVTLGIRVINQEAKVVNKGRLTVLIKSKPEA